MFSSYIEHPTHFRFEGQDPNEKILLVLRAHPVTNLNWIALSVLVFIIPFFIPAVLPLFNLNLSIIPTTFAVIFLIINYLLVLLISFEGFLYWYFNVYIVTEKNIVDVDFHSLMFKNIDIAPLRNIEDSSSSMAGLFSSVFNYGNVFVQTAGAAKIIDFHAVPRPHQVADFILDEAQKIHGRKKDANQ